MHVKLDYFVPYKLILDLLEYIYIVHGEIRNTSKNTWLTEEDIEYLQIERNKNSTSCTKMGRRLIPFLDFFFLL